MKIRDRIENNIVIWTLSMLLAGFLAGFATYRTILVVAGRTPIAEEKLQELEDLRLAAAASASKAESTCEKWAVRLVQRNEEVSDREEAIVVTGSAAGLPNGYELWLAATGTSESRSYYPRTKIDPEGKSWSIEVNPKLKTGGDRKRFFVFLVGPDGQALIQQYRSAMHEVAADMEWPPMTYMTADMDRCAGNHEVTLQ